jgi:hypothetical protein
LFSRHILRLSLLLGWCKAGPQLYRTRTGETRAAKSARRAYYPVIASYRFRPHCKRRCAGSEYVDALAQAPTGGSRAPRQTRRVGRHVPHRGGGRHIVIASTTPAAAWSARG